MLWREGLRGVAGRDRSWGPSSGSRSPRPPAPRCQNTLGNITSPHTLVARHGRSGSLRISQARASSAQVLLEDAALLPQVFDHLRLVTIHPPGRGREGDPPSDAVEHASSLQVGRRLRRHDGAAEFSDSTGVPSPGLPTREEERAASSNRS